MPRQLEFWTTEQPMPPGMLLWKDFEVEERTTVITLLARMITKAVHPPLTHQKEENPDER